MKIPSLLAQYLYNNHRLDLPGIGTFMLDSSSTNIPDNSKQRSAIQPAISFESKPGLGDSPDLVAYISSQTGKMKALANADLGSYLQLAQQFLNISKPFIFEGIGTLIMKRPGEYEFEPLGTPAEKIKDNRAKDVEGVSTKETDESYDSFLSKPKAKMEWNKPLIGLFIIAGIGLAVWAGYTISKRASGNTAKADIEMQTTLTDTLPKQDTTIIAVQPPQDTIPKNYKYVLEVSSKQRALKRYSQLKTNLWDVHLETKDSVQYKLFILLPSQNADTTRVVDSLTNWLGRKVYLDHQN